MSLGEDRIEPGDAVVRPKPANVKKKGTGNPAPAVARSARGRGWTVLTTLDRLLTILVENQSHQGQPDTSRVELLDEPEKTYLKDLTAAELIMQVRQVALREAIERR